MNQYFTRSTRKNRHFDPNINKSLAEPDQRRLQNHFDHCRRFYRRRSPNMLLLLLLHSRGEM
jgi:hypothetical protein